MALSDYKPDGYTSLTTTDFRMVKIPVTLKVGHLLFVYREYAKAKKPRANNEHLQDQLKLLLVRLAGRKSAIFLNKTSANILADVAGLHNQYFTYDANKRYARRVRQEVAINDFELAYTSFALSAVKREQDSSAASNSSPTTPKRISKKLTTRSAERRANDETEHEYEIEIYKAEIDRLREEIKNLREAAVASVQDEQDYTTGSISPVRGGKQMEIDSNYSPTRERLQTDNSDSESDDDVLHLSQIIGKSRHLNMQLPGRGKPFCIEVKLLAAKLCVMNGMSAAQVVACFQDLSNLFGYSPTAIPDKKSILKWKDMVLPLSQYQLIDTLQGESSIGFGTDKTTKKLSKSLKIGISTFIYHTSDNKSINNVFVAVPDGKGVTICNEFERSVRTAALDYSRIRQAMGELEQDEVIASAENIECALVPNITGGVFDQGSENSTMLKALSVYQTKLASKASVTGDDLSNLVNGFDEAMGTEAQNGNQAVVRLNCTLHIVALFTGVFFQCVEDEFGLLLETVYQDESYSKKFLTDEITRLLALIESRSDSYMSFGEQFHSVLAAKEPPTRYNTLWATLHHRDFAKLHNLAVLHYWYQETLEFLRDLEDSCGSGSDRAQRGVDLLEMPETKSVVRVGAIVHHFLLMPLLSQTTKQRGISGLQVQKEFVDCLSHLKACKLEHTLLSGNYKNYMEKVNYEFHRNQDKVANRTAIVDANENTEWSRKLITLIVSHFESKMLKWQPLLAQYYDPKTSESERLIIGRAIRHTPNDNSRAERSFGMLDRAISMKPSQLPARTFAETTAKCNNLFDYIGGMDKSRAEALVKAASSIASSSIRDLSHSVATAHQAQLATMRERTLLAKHKREADAYKLTEELTSELHKSPGGLFRSKQHAEAVIATLQPAKRRRKPSAAVLEKDKQNLDKTILAVLQLNLRFWLEIVYKPNGMMLDGVTPKSVKRLNADECMSRLELIWQKASASGQLGTGTSDLVGREIAMIFDDNTTKKGVIMQGLPFDASNKWWFVRFSTWNQDKLYLYDLSHEIKENNLENAEEVKQWLQ